MIPRRSPHVLPDELQDIADLCQNYRRDPNVVREWEHAVASYLGVAGTAAISSGRRGMSLILKHLGIQSGDEVIIPAYTLKDLVPIITNLGATVVPADIDLETLNVSASSIRARITDRTRAILVLHAFGCPCDMAAILEVAKGIPVVEDCAHSLGAKYHGKPTGSLGCAGFFSFEATKPVNTFGGGIVASQDPALAGFISCETQADTNDLTAFQKKVRATRTERILFSSGLAYPILFLLATPAFKGLVSRLYRLVQHAPPSDVSYSSVQAMLGLKKLGSLDKRIESLNEMADLLSSLLRPEIRPQRVLPECIATRYLYVAVLPSEARSVRRKLLLHGIDAGVGDEIADDCASILGYEDCPNTKDVYRHAIALPLYYGIPEKHVRKVAETLNRILDM